jgi:single-strand DNA-binding protein
MINKVILLGNVVADPEVRSMPSGDSITTIKLATNRKWKDKNGEKKEEAEFHRVTFFAGLAKVVADYVHKGDKLYVEGRIKTDKYQKNGVDVYSTGIVASEMQMLGGKQVDSGLPQRGANTRQAPVSAPDYDDIPFMSLNCLIRNHLI